MLVLDLTLSRQTPKVKAVLSSSLGTRGCVFSSWSKYHLEFAEEAGSKQYAELRGPLGVPRWLGALGSETKG